MSALPQSNERKLEPHLPKDLKDLGELAHLLFEWPIRQAPRLTLPACILVAALLQGGMIILFSISYSTPSELQPNAPQVYFIPPDSAISLQLAPWLAGNDPAIFSPLYDTRDGLPAPPRLRYRPSYEEPPPPLRPLPVESAQALVPPLLPQMGDFLRMKPHRLAALPDSASPIAPLPVLPTVADWQEGLAARQLLPASGATAPPLALSPLAQPSLYEVEVSAEGLPLHSVLVDSSGDPATDEAGNVWIHAQRFQPAEQASWGRVLLVWGAPTPVSKKP